MLYRSDMKFLLFIAVVLFVTWIVCEQKDAHKAVRMLGGVIIVCILIAYYELTLVQQGVEFWKETYHHTGNINSLVMLLEEEDPPDVLPLLKQYQLNLHSEYFSDANMHFSDDLQQIIEEYKKAHPEAFIRD